uniref:ATP-grasp domain-containing protein n=1 Tax=viral metagenome TaxID=1070528 RepID=A0A6C0F5E0_9ZZZZ|tara:strand:+ start:1191 stop:2333 length:1143 start_codon:yes stop_codon:yes gene_type:complete
MKIGIVVGINTDAISEERFPEWLEDIDDKTFNLSKEKWDDIYALGSDIAIAYYVKKFCKYDVEILTKKDVSLKRFNEFDHIFGFYEPYYYTHTMKTSEAYRKYSNIIKNTKAVFHQPLELQKFVLNKKLYTDTLQKNNIPVMDTISFQIKDNMNTKNILTKIKTQCNQWETDMFITKPQPGGFGIGFKKWNLNKVLKNVKPFESYIKKIEKQLRIEKPLLLVQNFASEFEKFYEVRTYWLNGKYSHSLGTIISPDSLGVSGFEKIKFAYPESEYDSDVFETYDEEPDVLDDKLIRKLKKMGKDILKIIPQSKYGDPFIFRIDFGCCINNKNVCRDYFVNEIEYMPNLFPEYSTHVDFLERIGKSIISKVNYVNNLKNKNK